MNILYAVLIFYCCAGHHHMGLAMTLQANCSIKKILNVAAMYLVNTYDDDVK